VRPSFFLEILEVLINTSVFLVPFRRDSVSFFPLFVSMASSLDPSPGLIAGGAGTFAAFCAGAVRTSHGRRGFSGTTIGGSNTVLQVGQTIGSLFRS
jgi:hypothetical protein